VSDYIEREAVCYQLAKQATIDGQPRAIKRAAKIVADFPAADVRPVVLCRDCKCYQQSHYIDNHMECSRSGVPVHSVDFCSFGEKREES
jgi:hypothetical protein